MTKLYPLEISCKTELSSSGNQEEPSPQQDVHLTRQAAVRAREHVAEWTSILRGPREDVDDQL